MVKLHLFTSSSKKGLKEFIKDALLFAVLLFFILFLIKKSVPFYWGNPLIAKKIKYVLGSPDDFDTFFIGSSKTYRHIVPQLYDAHVQGKSFNLGCSGMFALETEYILDHFIAAYPSSHNLEIFLQELSYKSIAKVNTHSIRSKYYLDFKRTRRALAHFTSIGNYKQAYAHFTAYIENSLAIGELFKIWQFHRSSGGGQLNNTQKKQKGYYALNQELELENNATLKKENADFKKMLQQNKIIPWRKQKLKLKQLPQKKLGINYSGVFIYQISGNPIDDFDFYFDKGHYNSRGAEIFTKEIAQARLNMK